MKTQEYLIEMVDEHIRRWNEGIYTFDDLMFVLNTKFRTIDKNIRLTKKNKGGKKWAKENANT